MWIGVAPFQSLESNIYFSVRKRDGAVLMSQESKKPLSIALNYVRCTRNFQNFQNFMAGVLATWSYDSRMGTCQSALAGMKFSKFENHLPAQPRIVKNQLLGCEMKNRSYDSNINVTKSLSLLSDESSPTLFTIKVVSHRPRISQLQKNSEPSLYLNRHLRFTILNNI